MSIDISQFHQTFFEESFEGLNLMETALVDLDPASPEAEVINAVFRAAHSIKGGSATFGFDQVADFTHVLETLLDEIRAGKRSLTAEHIDLLLQSVDCLRDMLLSLQRKQAPDKRVADALKAEFETVLAQSSDPADKTGPGEKTAGGQGVEPARTVSDPAEREPANGWAIGFKPGRDTLRTGNEPLRMFRELAALGDLTVAVDVAGVPAFTELDPELCYLRWDLTLVGDIEQCQITEVFEWVADDADIELRPLYPAPRAIEERSRQADEESPQCLDRDGPQRLDRDGPQRLDRGGPQRSDTESLQRLDIESPQRSDIESPQRSDIESPQRLDIESPQRLDKDGLQRSDIESPQRLDKDGLQRLDKDGPQRLDIENLQRAEIPSSGAGQGRANDGAAAAAKAPAPVPSAAITGGGESGSIRVGTDKIDNLINMVGELVITQSMLGELGTHFNSECLPKLLEGLDQLEQNTRELQESVMRIRMLPISFTFSRFPRLVRDLGRRLEKRIELKVNGEQTELDKTVMEKIGDPLVHLVRNAVDHGIESPGERCRVGKNATGKIVLNAYHQSGNVVIEVIDDGRGLDRNTILSKAIAKGLVAEKEAEQLGDEQIFDLIFQPGFSTAAAVSDVSGRGVGMDVVKRNIHALNGSVEIASRPGEGSKITVRLPLTMAILDGQLVKVGGQTYIFPLVSIVESLQSRSDQVSRVAGGCDVFQLRKEYVPILRLYELFDIEPESRDLDTSLLVVVECDGDKVGIVVDDLLAQQQVVIKSLEQNYRRVEGISGATILGDGQVALILDIPGLVRIAGARQAQSRRSRVGALTF